MASTARAALSRVTHTAAIGKVAFTRHPTALATAMVAIAALRQPDGRALRAADRVLASTLATHCDRDGLWWGGVNDVAAITGLSPHTVRVSARTLKRLGLIGWKWIKAHHRYPQRKGYFEGVRWGKGPRTRHGGRVWVFSWAQVGIKFEADRSGTRIAGLILQDQSGLIPEDQSTSGSSSVGYTDPGLRSPDGDRELSPPAASEPACKRETEASETPGAGVGSPSEPPRGRPPAADKRQGGNGQGSAERPAHTSALSREELAEVEASLEFLYKPGSRPPPSVPEHRRPRPPRGSKNES